MATEEKQVVEETAVVPGKMEFRLISPTESNFLKHIEWNKEELLAAVRSKVASYEGIVYTEETVKSAKNDRAELNNLVKANVIIQDERRQADIEYVAKKYGIDTNNPAMREAAEVTAVRSREAMEMGRTQRRYY